MYDGVVGFRQHEVTIGLDWLVLGIRIMGAHVAVGLSLFDFVHVARLFIGDGLHGVPGCVELVDVLVPWRNDRVADAKVVFALMGLLEE